MDPDANLKEQRKIARKLLRGHDVVDVEDKAYRLAELVFTLDNWLVGGGFLPARWNKIKESPPTQGEES